MAETTAVLWTVWLLPPAVANLPAGALECGPAHRAADNPTQ